MEAENMITLEVLLSGYRVDKEFVHSLQEIGLIELVQVEDVPCLSRDKLADFERLMHLHYDLEINLAGLDAISNLLGRIGEMQEEINRLRNRLGEI
jgi:chaperone modulatory protein CbpM